MNNNINNLTFLITLLIFTRLCHAMGMTDTSPVPWAEGF